jgi:PPOX class probable F420-dependent enzyme
MAGLTAAEKKLFTDKNFVVLSTTRRDGRPRAVVLWVDVDGDDLLVNGARSRAWIGNLRRDPRVALAIFDLQEPYRRVSVQGAAIEITDAGADEHYLSLVQKYRGLSPDEYRARRERAGGGDAEHRTIVRIRPETVTSRAD